MLTTRPSLRSANWLYLISMLLIISLGSWLQSRSLGWGLLATEFLLILLPVLLFIQMGRLRAPEVLRLRWPGLGLVLLGAVMGAGVWGLDMGLQALASALMGYAPASVIAALPTDPLNLLVFALAMMVAAPVCEEALFRGYLLSAYAATGRWCACWLSASCLLSSICSFRGCSRCCPSRCCWAIWPSAAVRWASPWRRTWPITSWAACWPLACG